jgi:hypothetical protein
MTMMKWMVQSNPVLKPGTLLAFLKAGKMSRATALRPVPILLSSASIALIPLLAEEVEHREGRGRYHNAGRHGKEKNHTA